MDLTLTEYLEDLKGKRVAVVGIGISNTPLIKLLSRAGIFVTACDKKEQTELEPLASELLELGVTLKLGKDYLLGLDHDVIFRSPGIRPDIKPFQDAVAKGSKLTSEMEVFFSVCPATIIAVTGSDGKTTTTTLIAQMLKTAGHNVFVGGNIGNPLLAETDQIKSNDFVVLELSSFQLMTLQKSPHIAVVTNLSPNHLDVHTSMEEYRNAKKAIFAYQNSTDIAIFNADNDETVQFSLEAPAQTMSFSRLNELDQGVFVREGNIIWRENGVEQVIFSTEDILIPGEHNIENYLACVCAVREYVSPEVMKQVATTFEGVEHRIEFVRQLKGVRFYNDSIASSPTRAIAGLRAFSNKVILIAGGYDKKIPFDEFGDVISNRVKHLVLVGDTASKIKDAVLASSEYDENVTPITEVDTLEKAVLQANNASVSGDVVLFSPACASFDQFPNFALRGKRFKELVRSL